MPRQMKGRDYFAENALPIAVDARDDPEPREPPHSHDFAELIIIRSGHGRHVVDGCDFAVSAGDVFLLQGQRVHGLMDTEGMRVFVVLFDQERLPLPHDELRRIPGYQAMFLLEPSYRRKHGFRSRLHLTRTALARVEDIWHDMQRECLDEAPGHSIVLLSRLLELIVFLSRHYAEIESSEGRALLAVAGVTGELEKHSSRPWRLAELAAHARMSESNLSRVFREAAGQSPIEYLIHLRLQKAMSLLRYRDWSITEIAYHVGFNDSNYFSRQFKQVTGMTPSAYRKGAGRDRR